MVEQFSRGLGESVGSLIRDVQRYRALPPLQKNRFRAGVGAGLITFGFYGLLRARFFDWTALAFCAPLIGFGVLWFYIGVRYARSQREILSAFWWALGFLFFGGLLVLGLYPSPDGQWHAIFRFLLQGFYLAGLVGSAVRLWLALRGMDTAGLEAIKAQQAHGTARDATVEEAAAKLSEISVPRPPRQFEN